MAGCHTLLICAYPCLSVGGTSLPEGSVCSACSVGHSLPVCLVMSVVVFSHRIHGIHGMLGCVIGGVGMAECHTLLICAHLCLSVGGTSLPEGSACSVGTLSPFAWLVHLRQVHPLRVPPESAPSAIGLRPLPDQIASATQSDCVRRPIRFRPPPDQIAFAIRSDSVRYTMP